MSNNEEDIAASSSSSSNSIKVRCLVQQCKNAKLYVKLADEANNIQPEYVQVCVYYSFNFFLTKAALNYFKTRSKEVLFFLFVL